MNQRIADAAAHSASVVVGCCERGICRTQHDRAADYVDVIGKCGIDDGPFYLAGQGINETEP